MDTSTPLTAEGFERLQKELKKLKSEERPKVIKAIAEARAYGDLSENAEYSAAREQQAFLEGRIGEIERILATAEIIPVNNSGEKPLNIKFGMFVKLNNKETKEVVSFRIVGEPEANVNNGLLSLNSPLARALIDRASGETVEVKTPGGSKVYSILEISHKNIDA